MGCLKCGKENKRDQVFCPECLQIMERYPIKPGTAIHLPHRQTGPVEKKSEPIQSISDSERIVQLRRIIRWLCATISVVTLLLCLLAALLLHNLTAQSGRPTIGRNYTTANTDIQP